MRDPSVTRSRNRTPQPAAASPAPMIPPPPKRRRAGHYAGAHDSMCGQCADASAACDRISWAAAGCASLAGEQPTGRTSFGTGCRAAVTVGGQSVGWDDAMIDTPGRRAPCEPRSRLPRICTEMGGSRARRSVVWFALSTATARTSHDAVSQVRRDLVCNVCALHLLRSPRPRLRATTVVGSGI